MWLTAITPSISFLVTPQGSSTFPPWPLHGMLGAHGAVQGATAQPEMFSRQHQGFMKPGHRAHQEEAHSLALPPELGMGRAQAVIASRGVGLNSLVLLDASQCL